MKFKITRQVPGVLRYEFAALEVEGEVKPDGAEFADAVSAADTWAREQRGKLPEKVLAALTQDGQQQGYTPRPAPAPAPSASRPAAAPAAPQASRAAHPAPSSEPASEALYGPLGFPVNDYKALLYKVISTCKRNGYTCATDEKASKAVERDFVRAASVYTNKEGRVYFTMKNTLQDMAADAMAKGWGTNGVSMCWDRMVRLAKALEADGHVELVVPGWDPTAKARKDFAARYEVITAPPATLGDSWEEGQDPSIGDGHDQTPF